MQAASHRPLWPPYSIPLVCPWVQDSHGFGSAWEHVFRDQKVTSEHCVLRTLKKKKNPNKTKVQERRMVNR